MFCFEMYIRPPVGHGQCPTSSQQRANSSCFSLLHTLPHAKATHHTSSTPSPRCVTVTVTPVTHTPRLLHRFQGQRPSVVTVPHNYSHQRPSVVTVAYGQEHLVSALVHSSTNPTTRGLPPSLLIILHDQRPSAVSVATLYGQEQLTLLF